MTQLFLNYAGVALPVSVLILVLALVRPALHRRYRARLLSWLWLVLAVRLLLPVQLASPQADVPVQVELPQTEYVVAVDEALLPDLAPPELPPEPENATLAAQELYRQEHQKYQQAMDEYTQEMADARREAGRIVTLPQVLCCIWLAGIAALAVWQTAAYLYTKKRIIKNAAVLAEPDTAKALRAELGLRHVIPMLQSERVTSPLVLGLVRPRLILPARAFDPAELEMVLRHELTHIRRGDITNKLLLNLTVLVHWYDPLVWLARHLAAQDVELACDEAVLAGKDSAYRAAYADSLFKTAASMVLDGQRGPLLSTSFSNSKNSLKQRFSAICSRIVKRPGRAVLIAAVCLALLAGGVTAVTVKPQEPPEESPSSDAAYSEPIQTVPQGEASKTAAQVLEMLQGDWESFRYLAEYEPGFQAVDYVHLEGEAVFTRDLSIAEREDLRALVQPELWTPCEERTDLDWQDPELLLLDLAHTRVVLKEDTALVIFWDLPYWLEGAYWFALPEGAAAAAAQYCADLPEKPYTETPLPAVADCTTLSTHVTPWDYAPMPMTQTLYGTVEGILHPESWQRIAIFSGASGLGSGTIRLNDADGNILGLYRSTWAYTEDGKTGLYRQFRITEEESRAITDLSDVLNEQTRTAPQDYTYLVTELESAVGVYQLPKALLAENVQMLAQLLDLENREKVTVVPELYTQYVLYNPGGRRLEICTDADGALYAAETDATTAETTVFVLDGVSADGLGTLLYAYVSHTDKADWVVCATSADGLWNLYSQPVSPLDNGAAHAWILEDVQRQELRTLCTDSLRHGSRQKGFFENGDLYIVEPDGLHVYTAADGYRTEKGLNMTFRPDFIGPILLHTVRRDPVSMEYTVLYSQPENGVSEYFIAECDADGTPLVHYATGVKVVWMDEAQGISSGMFFEEEGGVLTAMREYGIMPYDAEPVFRFDLSTHAVEDLSDQLSGSW